MSPGAGATGAAVDGRARLRRRDRGKDDGWIRAFLARAPFGFLATVGEEGQPFINSNLFVYDEARNAIWLHTHRTGRTPGNVAAYQRVTFSAAAMGRLLPASEALEFSVEYAGVVVFGKGRVVNDAEEARYGLRLLLGKYAPHLEYDVDYRGTSDADLKRTAVYRIDIEAWSGKQKEEAADFPGAYDLPSVPVPFPTRSPVTEGPTDAP